MFVFLLTCWWFYFCYLLQYILMAGGLKLFYKIFATTGIKSCMYHCNLNCCLFEINAYITLLLTDEAHANFTPPNIPG